MTFGLAARGVIQRDLTPTPLLQGEGQQGLGCMPVTAHEGLGDARVDARSVGQVSIPAALVLSLRAVHGAAKQ